MKSLIPVVLLFLALFSVNSFALETEDYFDPRTGKTVEVAKGQVLVRLKAGMISALSGVEKDHKMTTLSTHIGQVKLMKAQDKAKSVSDIVNELKSDPSVQYAEPNFIRYALAVTPNDTLWSQQYGPTHISCEAAWDIQKGSSSIKVAVVDSGVLITHEDLVNRVVSGYNFVDGNTDPTDTNGHGTHVAGIIGAEVNNSKGIAGVDWSCKIIPVRVLGTNGRGTVSDISDGIRWAADNGAKVINMSLGSSSSSETENSACQYAYGKGCVMIVAAGNDNTSLYDYPASYDNMISIAATQQTDERAWYSNYNDKVCLSAPGGENRDIAANDIISTYIGGPSSYETSAGTSMAAPYVAGLASLLLAEYPTWTNVMVRDRMITTAKHLGTTGRNVQYGHGMINANSALTGPAKPFVNPVTSPTNARTVTITGTKGADVAEILVNSATTGVTIASATSWTYTGTLSAGTNTFSIEAKDSGSKKSSAETVSIVLAKLDFSDPKTRASVSVPIGATSTTEVMTVEEYANPEALQPYPPSRTLLGSAVEFDSVFSLLLEDATIMMEVPDGAIDPQPYYWDPATNSWTNKDITVLSVSGGYITFLTEHFSIYAIFGIQGSIPSITVYPNPFTIGSSAGVIFDGLTGDETIRIFTVSGELVKSFAANDAHIWTWDATNTGSNRVARGIYVYLITNPAGQKKIGRLAILD